MLGDQELKKRKRSSTEKIINSSDDDHFVDMKYRSNCDPVSSNESDSFNGSDMSESEHKRSKKHSLKTIVDTTQSQESHASRQRRNRRKKDKLESRNSRNLKRSGNQKSYSEPVYDRRSPTPAIDKPCRRRSRKLENSPESAEFGLAQAIIADNPTPVIDKRKTETPTSNSDFENSLIGSNQSLSDTDATESEKDDSQKSVGGRRLRRKNSIDYRMQLMPKNLERILDRDARAYDSGEIPPPLFSSRGRRDNKSEKKPNLRKKGSVNYSKQLMPKNFTQILDKEFKEYEAFEHPRKVDRNRNHNNSPQRNRLNEDEEDSTPTLAKGRFLALFGARTSLKGANLPINMSEMMVAEEAKLMIGVDEKTKELFQTNSGIKPRETIPSISFADVAGFDDYIKSLKEMIALPLMYPDIFEQFDISPPRGVLFHGPPGTGKTLMARALAASCSTPTRPVAFFMRKGADILNKWVGESERQLKILFEQAKAWEPSIIFFDEIDGLAPVRSSKQDQIHASVVSTFLALMDGLENRGQVVVIGATNRIDAIDPALRRPGRFDREFYFGLPSEEARKKIITRTTKKWNPPVEESLVNYLAKITRGYNGADVKALCTEAALSAVRRTYPQIYDQDVKYMIDCQEIKVSQYDFLQCISKMVSSTDRNNCNAVGKPLPVHLIPILNDSLEKINSAVKRFLPLLEYSQKMNGCVQGNALWINDYLKGFEPRIMICGPTGMGQQYLGSAIINLMEKSGFYIQTIDITRLMNRVENEVEGIIIQAFHEVKRHKSAVIYLPFINQWWCNMTELCQKTFLTLLNQIRHDSHILIATCNQKEDELSDELKYLFNDQIVDGWKFVFNCESPTRDCILNFFKELLKDIDRPAEAIVLPPSQGNVKLDIIESTPNITLSEKEKEAILKEEEEHCRLLRQYFMNIIDDLKKNFKHFARPVDREQFPEYMPDQDTDLLKIGTKIQKNRYEVPEDFTQDIELLINNTIEFNSNEIPHQKEIISKAMKLGDAYAEHISCLPQDFVQACWYFYLFRRSSISKGLDIHKEEAQSITNNIEVINDDDVEQMALDSLLNQVPDDGGYHSEDISNEHVLVNPDDVQMETEAKKLDQDDINLTQRKQKFNADDIEELANKLASLCDSNTSVSKIEDMGALVASHVLNNENYTKQSIINLFF